MPKRSLEKKLIILNEYNVLMMKKIHLSVKMIGKMKNLSVGVKLYFVYTKKVLFLISWVLVVMVSVL